MLLIDSTDVGSAALARMRRDRVLTALTDEAGVAPDAAALHIARALALAPWVPRKAAATGLAALWCYGLIPYALLPAHVEVVVPRGTHPDPPPGVPRCRWSFTTHHTSYARAQVITGVRMTSPADAVASALRTADLRHAIPAAYTATASGLATAADICTAVSQHQSGNAGTRALEAWKAVQGALEGR